ncbi:uncharacterized protein LOC135502970 [Lineus longissimus]|uniref:uncharacterized protein LOC135502970 n=1 Tax=Lineus longissimus TaxID=88925 RepID=UPI00315CD308
MKMTGITPSVYFESVAFNWALSLPDFSDQHTTSILACAVLCSQLICSTVNMLEDEKRVCQLSKKKGKCMERDEAFRHASARMYQKKDIRNVMFINDKTVPFKPPLIVQRNRGAWYFDKKSGRIILITYPKTNPFYSLMVYKLGNGSYDIQYKSTFYQKLQHYHTEGNYHQYITLSLLNPKTKRSIIYFYDIVKGICAGVFTIPKNDACNRFGIAHPVIGFQEKVLIVCKQRAHLKATLYDSVECNQTGSFQLLLRNGSTVDLKTMPFVVNGNIYKIGVLRAYYIVSYRKRNMYDPVYYLIKNMKQLDPGTENIELHFNPWSGSLILLGVPGPSAIGFNEVYKPKHGLINDGYDGRGKMAFREFKTSFSHRQKSDRLTANFMFNPSDGSLLHLLRVPTKAAKMNEYLTSVVVYKLKITS